jgi:hypothetical protein
MFQIAIVLLLPVHSGLQIECASRIQKKYYFLPHEHIANILIIYIHLSVRML